VENKSEKFLKSTMSRQRFTAYVSVNAINCVLTRRRDKCHLQFPTIQTRC